VIKEKRSSEVGKKASFSYMAYSKKKDRTKALSENYSSLSNIHKLQNS